MPKKPTPIPSVHPAIVHAASVIKGEVRYYMPSEMHYIVVPLGQGENASVSIVDDNVSTDRGWVVSWPFGSVERRRFICPNLTEVVKLLAELSVTPLPEKEVSNDIR